MDNVILQAVDRSDFRGGGNSANSAVARLLFSISDYLFCEHGGHHILWSYSAGPSVEEELEGLKYTRPDLFAALEEASLSTIKRTGQVLARYYEMTDFYSRNRSRTRL